MNVTAPAPPEGVRMIEFRFNYYINTELLCQRPGYGGCRRKSEFLLNKVLESIKETGI